MPLTKLEIDQIIFEEAFGRDVDFHDPYARSPYLDRDAGDIIWVYDDDNDAKYDGVDLEDNRRLRQSIETAPERWLKIPGLSHGEHHGICKEFLKKELKNGEHLYTGSIGGTLAGLDEETRRAFFEYRDQRIAELAEEFLASHSINPVWR